MIIIRATPQMIPRIQVLNILKKPTYSYIALIAIIMKGRVNYHVSYKLVQGTMHLAIQSQLTIAQPLPPSPFFVIVKAYLFTWMIY